MKNETNNSAEVIELEKFKRDSNDLKESESLSRYFKVLSFSELLNETTQIIEELNSKGGTEEVIKRSKLILKEMGLRLKNSQGLSKSFLKMKSELERRLQ